MSVIEDAGRRVDSHVGVGVHCMAWVAFIEEFRGARPFEVPLDARFLEVKY